MKQNKKGFTLIEVAIVLTIFGIIIAGVIILVSTAMENQRQVRLSQQIITVLEDVRSYARRVDNSTINLVMNDFNNLGLLPQDVTSNGAGVYIDAVSQPMDGCAAGGTNVTQCGVTGLSNMIAIVPKNLTQEECIAVLTKLSSSVGDLVFVQYIVNGNVFLTSNTTNLGVGQIATNCTPQGGVNTVNLELDFGY